MDSDLSTLVAFLLDLLKAGGPFAMLGVLLTGLLKVYRLPLVQSLVGKLSPKLLWDNFPSYLKVALPFLLACLGVALPGYLLGSLSLAAALVAGVNAGLLAIGLHHAAKESVADRTGKPLPVDPKALEAKVLAGK